MSASNHYHLGEDMHRKAAHELVEIERARLARRLPDKAVFSSLAWPSRHTP
jgi:hypothetical protein